MYIYVYACININLIYVYLHTYVQYKASYVRSYIRMCVTNKYTCIRIIIQESILHKDLYTYVSMKKYSPEKVS